jgi:predicted Co/Zn/Cd cation transporter (cation efflux family)
MKEGIKGFSLYVPGALFVILGILVVFFPMLLVGLFSAGLILIGITAMSVAHHLRKRHRNSHWTVTWEHVDPFVEEWQHRVFARRRW